MVLGFSGQMGAYDGTAVDPMIPNETMVWRYSPDLLNSFSAFALMLAPLILL